MSIRNGVSITLFLVWVASRVIATLHIPHLRGLMLPELPSIQLLPDATLLTVVDPIQLPLGKLDPLSWLQLRLHHRPLPREAQS